MHPSRRCLSLREDETSMLYADGYRRIRIARPPTHTPHIYTFVNNFSANSNDDTSRLLASRKRRDSSHSSWGHCARLNEDLESVSLEIFPSIFLRMISECPSDYILYEIRDYWKRWQLNYAHLFSKDDSKLITSQRGTFRNYVEMLNVRSNLSLVD